MFRAFVLMQVVAALLPLCLAGRVRPAQPPSADVDWPNRLLGRDLVAEQLTAQDQAFMRDFPGTMRRFSDGQRRIIARAVRAPTRQLHPSADCLKGMGYRVSPQPLWRDPEQNLWSCVSGVRKGEALRVCERIYDTAGGNWSDASSWYWAAMLQKTAGPWIAVTIVE